MASSKLPPKNSRALKQPLQQSVFSALTQAFTQTTSQKPKLLLALSGGLDSSVLLHVLVQIQVFIPFKLSAMYVHHGLSPHADAWADFCLETCQQYAVPCEVVHVTLGDDGLGIEASARKARYQALQAAQADWICLAHHEDDQAETLLLQLARGAGVKGLSGMANIDSAKQLMRPLLTHSREALEAYAKQYDLKWVEDESNQILTYDRNFMRHAVLPTLAKQYPAIKKTLSRSATHLAETSELLHDLASIDAAHVLVACGATTKLIVAELALLSEARAKNVMRYWLAASGVLMPSTAVLTQMLQQLCYAKSDASVKVKIAPNYTVRKYLDAAYIVPDYPAIHAYNILWKGEAEIAITDSIYITFHEEVGKGLSLKKLQYTKLRIKNREGGERMRPVLGRPSRTIKHLLQMHKIPPWQRERWPLICADEQLVTIPNIADDVHMLAASDEMGLVISCRLD